MRSTRNSRAIAPLLGSVIAVSSVFVGSFAQDVTPRGIHISLGADARTTATVSWHTNGFQDPGTVVEWGTTPSLSQGVSGTGSAAPESVPVILHEVVLAGLPGGAEIFYRAGSELGWSATRSFRTSPNESRFRFTVFGDHGTKPAAQRTTALVREAAPNLHLIAGDVSYANSDPAVWNTWFEQTESVFAHTPVMPAPGNHDTESTQTGNGAVAYLARFALPGEELFYSFDFGRVHFTIFHSTYEADPAGVPEQLAFLEQDLRDAAARRDAGELDFLIVVQHHPLWANFEDQDLMRHYLERRANPVLIALEENALVRYGVDVLITGHNHHYERSKPMMYATATDPRTTGYQDPPGYVEIVTGGGGTGLYEFRDPGDFPEWSAAHARRFHFVQFDIDGPSMTVSAIATDENAGEILDTWTLQR